MSTKRLNTRWKNCCISCNGFNVCLTNLWTAGITELKQKILIGLIVLTSLYLFVVLPMCLLLISVFIWFFFVYIFVFYLFILAVFILRRTNSLRRLVRLKRFSVQQYKYGTKSLVDGILLSFHRFNSCDKTMHKLEKFCRHYWNLISINRWHFQTVK